MKRYDCNYIKDIFVVVFNISLLDPGDIVQNIIISMTILVQLISEKEVESHLVWQVRFHMHDYRKEIALVPFVTRSMLTSSRLYSPSTY